MSKFIERRKGGRLLNKKIVVLYHGNCSDGFGGAWAAFKKFGNKAEYVAVFHQLPPPAGLKNKEIYLIDFSYALPVMKKIIGENIRVTAIDHHITAKAAVALTKDYLYLNNHSGAVLAWKYFHRKKQIPQLLRYIEDMDLWRFRVPHTKEIFAALDLMDFNFKIWNKLAADIQNVKLRQKYIERGKLILSYETKLVQRTVANNAELVLFAGHKVLAVNSQNFSSEIGNLLCNKVPPLGIVWSAKRGQIVVSLRSNGSVNVAKIAERYGGGGHKRAAGFSLKAEQKLPWRRL